MTEDRQWLEAFRRDQSEFAFRCLVERYLGLVYSAAFRLVNGDAHLAQDVAQLVFINLANKAHCLPANVVLAGWLHRDTRFTALEMLRKEQRRIVREQTAVTMQSLENAGVNVDWSRLRPLLDETLQALDPEDRNAILLRFFEGLSFAQVGSALGLSEDTARKRIGSSLARLRERLAAQGVTATASALSVALVTHGVERVPSGLSQQIAAAALTSSAATTSTVGILTFMSSAKTTVVLVAGALLLTIGGASLKFLSSTGNLAPAGTLSSPISPGSLRSQTVNQSGSNRQSRLAVTSIRDRQLALALERVRKVLNGKAPRRYPNAAMEEALAALGGERRAALPILLEGLRSQNLTVRILAADAVGLLGGEAKAAAPELMTMLRAGTDLEAHMSVRALAKIGPLPELLPELIQAFKGNAVVRLDMANSFTELAGSDTGPVITALRPLLQDTDPAVRNGAAYAMALMLRSQAGPEIIQTVMAGLSATDEDQRGNALCALKNMGTNPRDPSQRIQGALFSDQLTNALPALAQIANRSPRKDHQQQALELLNALQPNLRRHNPGMDRVLQEQEQAAVFARRARAGELTVSDLVHGLTQHPQVIEVTAQVLAEAGSEAQSALPTLRTALNTLATDMAGSMADKVERNRQRDAVADAIHKIAPDKPKPLFTEQDVQYIMEVVADSDVRLDQKRKTNLARALQGAISNSPNGGTALRPDQVQYLLAALKETDPPVFEAIAGRVQALDPRFTIAP